ncbi:glycoside hydrolase family protein [Weissella viridescens]
MKTSDNGLNLIKEFEGFRSAAYDLDDGGWTIGYGSFNVTGVGPGTVWTKEQATAQLRKDVVRFENAINGIGANLNQNQFDALVSFTYNLGPGWISQYPTIAQALRNGNWQYVTDSMKNFVNPGSPYEAGLRRRRSVETSLFKKPAVMPKYTPAQKAFIKAGNAYDLRRAIVADEIKHVNGMWQAVNYELAGSRNFNWTDNGIPLAICDKTNAKGEKTGDQNTVSPGDFIRLQNDYNHGMIDQYDVPSNGVGITMGSYGMIWFNADTLLKL